MLHGSGGMFRTHHFQKANNSTHTNSEQRSTAGVAADLLEKYYVIQKLRWFDGRRSSIIQ